MLKNTSKELDFHADFKYLSFIKFSLCHQKLRAWEKFASFWGTFCFGGGIEGGTMWEDRSLEEYVMGEDKMSENGAGFSSSTIKKTIKKLT